MPRATKDTGRPSVEEQLDAIVEYLRRMDKRDRLRTWGGFFKGILGLIPIAVLLLSIWYFYEYGDELITKITQQAAKEAASMTGDSASELLKQIELVFPQPTPQ